MPFIETIDTVEDIENSQKSAISFSLQEKNGEEAAEQENLSLNGIIDLVTTEFNRSKDKRRNDEERWLLNYENYRGHYDRFTTTEKSEVFVKITKTKVLAAQAQLTDVLFAGNKFPIGVEPQKFSIGVEDKVNFDPKDSQAKGGDPSISATISRPEILKLTRKLT